MKHSTCAPAGDVRCGANICDRRMLLSQIVKRTTRARAKTCAGGNLQKSAYLLKELFQVPFLNSCEFTLSRYGPKADELARDICVMARAGAVLKTTDRYNRDFYSLGVDNDLCTLSMSAFSETYGDKINFVVERFEGHTARYLENLSAAFWVVFSNQAQSWRKQIDLLCELLKDISPRAADIYVQDAKTIIVKSIERFGDENSFCFLGLGGHRSVEFA